MSRVSTFQGELWGVPHLSWAWMCLFLADMARRQLEPNERREAFVNDELVIDELDATSGHALLRAFVFRMVSNTNHDFAACVRFFSRLFGYNDKAGRRFNPLLILQKFQSRLKIAGVKQAIRAIQDVFKEEYIGRLYKEEFQAAYMALVPDKGWAIGKIEK
jgi:hypothetical protein